MSWFNWLGQFSPSRIEEVTATVVERTRSTDGEVYDVVFKEDSGQGRTFTQTFAYYGPGGVSAPKPHLGTKATLRVNTKGEVVYAGSTRPTS